MTIAIRVRRRHRIQTLTPSTTMMMSRSWRMSMTLTAIIMCQGSSNGRLHSAPKPYILERLLAVDGLEVEEACALEFPDCIYKSVYDEDLEHPDGSFSVHLTRHRQRCLNRMMSRN